MDLDHTVFSNECSSVRGVICMKQKVGRNGERVGEDRRKGEKGETARVGGGKRRRKITSGE